MVKESIVKSIRNAYQEASKKQRIATGNPVVASLPEKSKDVLFYWVILLTENYIQLYLRKFELMEEQ